jgi:hypothetical protein
MITGMSQYELEKQWTTRDDIAGVDFRFGDIVRINKSEHRDELFAVVALFSLTPQPTFGVTRVTDEHFLTVLQEDLEHAGENNGRELAIRTLDEKS